MKKGDYVLATKYRDGDPCDHFVVGFFSHMIPVSGGERYMVVDNEGNQFRGNGFRRCERIQSSTGNAFVAAMPIIGDVPGKSIWWWRRHLKELRKLT